MPEPERRRVLLAGLGDLFVDVVCLVAPSDELPLRLTLLVRHLDEDVPIFATIFDEDIASQLREAVPHLDVASHAEIAAPSPAGPCIQEGLAGVLVAMAARSLADELRVVLRAGDGEVAQETGSLFRIGHVIDVHRVAAALMAARTLGGDEHAVVTVDGEPELLSAT